MSLYSAGSRVLVIAACAGNLACYPTAQPTPPPASAPAAAVALAGASVMIGAGDIARCVFTGDESTARIVDSILVADSVAKVPDAVFTLGDNVQSSGAMSSWTNCFTPSWGRTRIMKNIRPTPGNHDHVMERADAYFEYYGAAAGPAGKGYYSYNIGEWHAVVINSEMIINPAYDPAAKIKQMEWLVADLKSNTKSCTIAYWHNPRFSSGAHGSDVRLSPIWTLLGEHGVDLVLSGHDHHYERFAPMSAAGALDTLKGITSFVVGTGGAELRGLSATLAANSVVRIQGHYGVLLLTLGAKEFRSAFIDTSGRVWDPSGGKCH